MKAILVLNHGQIQNFRVMVSLSRKPLIEKVNALLAEGRAREAFDILKSRAEVIAYLPKGQKAPESPEITLFEDML